MANERLYMEIKINFFFIIVRFRNLQLKKALIGLVILLYCSVKEYNTYLASVAIYFLVFSVEQKLAEMNNHAKTMIREIKTFHKVELMKIPKVWNRKLL